MREIYEFRIPEELAASVLPRGAGIVLGGTVRKVTVQGNSPLFETIRAAQEAAQARSDGFYTSWSVQRQFSPGELESASLFRLRTTAVTDQAGEPVGDGPDRDGIALDLRKLRKREFVDTMAGEHLVCERVAGLILDERLTGVELRRVWHSEQKADQQIELAAVPAGRQLLEQAAAEGHPHPGWSFWVWLNRPEQEPLLAAAEDQHWALKQAGRRRRAAAAPPWYQLVVVSQPVSTVLPTRFGVGPFDEDEEGEFRDPAAGVAGLKILSPCYVAEEDWDGSDFAVTREKVGREAGLRRPAPLLLASRRTRELFIEHGVKGVSFEVAHLVRNGERTFPVS